MNFEVHITQAELADALAEDAYAKTRQMQTGSGCRGSQVSYHKIENFIINFFLIFSKIRFFQTKFALVFLNYPDFEFFQLFCSDFTKSRNRRYFQNDFYHQIGSFFYKTELIHLPLHLVSVSLLQLVVSTSLLWIHFLTVLIYYTESRLITPDF